MDFYKLIKRKLVMMEIKLMEMDVIAFVIEKYVGMESLIMENNVMMVILVRQMSVIMHVKSLVILPTPALLLIKMKMVYSTRKRLL